VIGISVLKIREKEKEDERRVKEER